MAKLQVFTLDNLTLYDELIKGYVDSASSAVDVKSLKTVAIDGNVLKFYKVEEPVGDTVPAYEITLPQTDLTDVLTRLTALEDGKADKANTYTKTEVDATIKTNTDAIAALEETVKNIQENAYDDTELRGLISDNTEAIEAHKDEIDGVVATLVGNDTGKSVRTIANEELAAQLIGDNAKESLDTLEEIAAWIQSHPDDASAMNKAIEDLEALVGTLPEGVTATTIVGYIQELVNAEKLRAEGIESGLETRLQAVEQSVGEGGSVDSQIDAKIADLDADITSAIVEEGEGIQVQVVEVDGKVTSVAVTGNYDNSYDTKGAAATAESNAKAYADGKDTAIAEAKKAGTDASAAVTALSEGQVATNTAAIAENTEAIANLQTTLGEGVEPITDAEINALFA